MRKWLVLYEDAPQRSTEIHQGALSDQKVDVLFDDAATSGTIDGRTVHAMWLVDPATEQEDVVAVYGWYPPTIQDRITARTRCYRRIKSLRVEN